MTAAEKSAASREDSAIGSIVAGNLARVREQIAAAAERAGRSPDGVTLVGVSKYVDAAATRALADAGCVDLGESRPQQLWQKAESPELKPSGAESDGPEPVDVGVRWHMVGHLQRNKVKRTLPITTLIHGVDSERLLRAISEQSPPDQPTRVLLEVNTSGDVEKHGLTPDAARELVARQVEFPNVEMCGLMTMAAREGGEPVARRNFHSLRELRDEVLPGGELSMGMSGDFEAAIAEGSTIVRIGTALWTGIL